MLRCRLCLRPSRRPAWPRTTNPPGPRPRPGIDTHNLQLSENLPWLVVAIYFFCLHGLFFAVAVQKSFQMQEFHFEVFLSKKKEGFPSQKKRHKCVWESTQRNFTPTTCWWAEWIYSSGGETKPPPLCLGLFLHKARLVFLRGRGLHIILYNHLY